jgi:hypothetical protein
MRRILSLKSVLQLNLQFNPGFQVGCAASRCRYSHGA